MIDDDETVSWRQFERRRAEMLAELAALVIGVARARARDVIHEGIRDGVPLADVAVEAERVAVAVFDRWQLQADLVLPDLPEGEWH